jgi:hypothetical protein
MLGLRTSTQLTNYAFKLVGWVKQKRDPTKLMDVGSSYLDPTYELLLRNTTKAGVPFRQKETVLSAVLPA